jgi:chemotaxis protein CheD
MFSASSGFAAICHAMLPENITRDGDLRYVDTALRYMYEEMVASGVGKHLVVKLFGGAQVLDVGNNQSTKLTVGDQNVSKAEAVLVSLGFTISTRDTGGLKGRKLFFCTRSGDVFTRLIRPVVHPYCNHSGQGSVH